MKTAAHKTYLKEFSAAMIAYVIVLLVAITVINASPASAWWRYPLALTPVIPAIFGMIAYIRFIRRMDELQRRIQFEALAIAFASAGILTFSYGFLELVGLPHINWIFVFPFMIMLWGISSGFTSRRYS
ncbi:hypothetical protein [Dictyobacter kobayashii]|uniref:Uncharacterized protein n=1 Tax=Dictyobacter kobayashii TaxID=2014872 RepID=A0A402AR69_9CHLR|nr:hypothetical protein [Dictyobacter kobayashii]GCE21587.1 hypothetical protein KDK_53870 [Dictyobacter kobayashii]